MQIKENAFENVHFELVEEDEVEIYIGSWFLCSVDIKNISPEAKEWLFEDENN